MPYRVPIATYRLQFNAQFTFRDAGRIVGYLSRLGISDLYASPLLRARTGSTHGYDVVDATALNPQLGDEGDFNSLHDELGLRNMGLVLDIVPNHMAASHENAWWVSVLENGPRSRYLHYFDIDWRSGASGARTEERVLLPILGKPYGETLESNEITLGFDAEGFFFSYYDKRLPLAPASYHLVLRECLDALPAEGVELEVADLVQNDAEIANSRFLKETLWRIHEQSAGFREALALVVATINNGAPESLTRLDALLDAQWYRLAFWRIASETINYRRFFDVTDLVGVRVENPEVFEQRTRRILELIAEGKVTGVRIDHIDGLHDPDAYLARMQTRLGEADGVAPEPFYIVVEKILEEGETLPRSFRCAGTTGYDFLDTANALFVDPESIAPLTSFYESRTGDHHSFDDLVYERKKQVIDLLFAGEMRALGTHLGALAVSDRNARDFAPSELLAALVEITACLPVYRTYIREFPPGDEDRRFIRQAVGEARHRARGVDQRLFDFLEMVLLLEPPAYIESERARWLEFVMRWQQFTGRVMAKGVEDTAFYSYNRLLSLNEVGGLPGRAAGFDPVAELHARNERIARDWPDTMNATSTHDTKRSEDVRARIHVLSELPASWAKEARHWSRVNSPLKAGSVPDSNEELMLYQTLLGVWPLDERELPSLPGRLDLFLEKAVREAKTHSSWLAPDEAYEAELKAFAGAVVEHQPFLAAFRPLQRRVAFHGFLNSIAQVVVKVCSPGVPDFYQGSELWDFSLVDPDNRRPVDYDLRQRSLRKLASIPALLRNWKDGRVKLFVTQRALEVRARQLAAFRGSYAALETGTANAVAFLRGESVLTVVPRLTSRLARAPKLPLGDVWGDHRLALSGRWRNAFTGESIEGSSLPLRDVFATFPVAILERA